MTVSKDLPVPYHQQNTDYYCGAACAQMVLEEIGGEIFDQDDLYDDNHHHSTTEGGWYTAPDGLQWTMNNRRPTAFVDSFLISALDNEGALSRKLVWTLYKYQAAPIALVFGSQHWVVVRGYDVTAEPTDANDSSYNIEGFYINNPCPALSDAPPPPPHGDNDGCGTGGDRGVADEHISYSTWQSTYMTGVTSGFWQGKFVGLCDPDPASISSGKGLQPLMRRSNDQLLTHEVAIERAVRGMKTHGLYEKPAWKKTLARTSPGEPVLVQRLDRSDSFYYLIPMQSGQSATPVIASVDALYGHYRQSVASHGRGANVLRGLSFDPDSAVKKIVGTRIDFGDRGGRIMVREGGYTVNSTLVWKPCRESLSPFYPFHMVTIGERQVYVRVDGQVFTQLNVQGRGL